MIGETRSLWDKIFMGQDRVKDLATENERDLILRLVKDAFITYLGLF